MLSGALLGLALLLLLRGPGAAGGSQLVTNAWNTASGLSARTAFLTRCEAPGASAATCVCMFEEVTGQVAYSTPRAFASLDLMGATPAPGAASVLAGAIQACPSTPAGVPPSTPPAPARGSGGPPKDHPV